MTYILIFNFSRIMKLQITRPRKYAKHSDYHLSDVKENHI